VRLRAIPRFSNLRKRRSGSELAEERARRHTHHRAELIERLFAIR
jgi:hypothetical protein